MQPDEKTCPKCAETVKRAAEVCRFCRYSFVAGTDRPVLNSIGIAAGVIGLGCLLLGVVSQASLLMMIGGGLIALYLVLRLAMHAQAHAGMRSQSGS